MKVHFSELWESLWFDSEEEVVAEKDIKMSHYWHFDAVVVAEVLMEA